jgi:hypothetical protein
MASAPTANSNFAVTSGALCFGDLHNIWRGASIEIQEPVLANPKDFDGVLYYTPTFNFNYAALNGTWDVFQLTNLVTQAVSGWFVCHTHFDPVEEIGNIIRVSPSPYERGGHGSRLNTVDTYAERVLVVNRLMWGISDERSIEVVEELQNYDPYDETWSENLGISLGLVDYQAAKSQFSAWKADPQHRRNHSAAGVWMFVRDEYGFARFGLDDNRIAVKSLLFFTEMTSFQETAFSGLSHALVKYPTAQEDLDRLLLEGHNFDGVDIFRGLQVPVTPEVERLGPFNADERLFDVAHVDDIRSQLRDLIRSKRPGKIPIVLRDFADSWKERSVTLLNEVVMSYLARYVVPAMSGASSCETFANAHCTSRDSADSIDAHVFTLLTEPYSGVQPSLSHDLVEKRIQAFLDQRSDNGSLVYNDDFVARIRRVAEYIVGEVLELANNWAHNRHLDKLVPEDVRFGIAFDPGIWKALAYSHVFWGSQP